MTHWASDVGRTVLHQLSDLYRALVWEGFILLAVAAEEENSPALKPEPPSIADKPPTEPQQQEGVEGERAPVPMELEAATSSAAPVIPSVMLEPPPDTQGDTPLPKPLPLADSDHLQHPSILVESLKQLTPLLTITSRVGRSLAELMSLLIRLSTSPLHRAHRRGVGHPLIVHSYQEPAKEAIQVCMEVTNLLVDSLKWEVPMPQACSSAMHSPIRDWLFAG